MGGSLSILVLSCMTTNNSPDETTTDENDYLSKAKIARRLGRTTRTIESWMKAGYLPYYKIGRTVLFRWSDVQAHLEQNHRKLIQSQFHPRQRHRASLI